MPFHTWPRPCNIHQETTKPLSFRSATNFSRQAGTRFALLAQVDLGFQKVYCLAVIYFMSLHNDIGKIGEDLARKYLEKEGWKIIEQNYKTKYAEIDLVALRQAQGKLKNIFSGKQDTLVFVEVRTKVGEQWGSPEDTINKAKLWKVLQNAKSYAAFKRWDGPARIDAICIVLKNDFSVSRLTHHENIVS